MKLIDADAAKELWSGDHPIAVTMRKIFDDLPAVNAIPVPCKVGDTVWGIGGYSFKIEKIEIFEGGMLFRCGNPGTDDYMAFHEDDIGERIFFTKEDAEKNGCRY